jgi:hypothetical protein
MRRGYVDDVHVGILGEFFITAVCLGEAVFFREILCSAQISRTDGVQYRVRNDFQAVGEFVGDVPGGEYTPFVIFHGFSLFIFFCFG